MKWYEFYRLLKNQTPALKAENEQLKKQIDDLKMFISNEEVKIKTLEKENITLNDEKDSLLEALNEKEDEVKMENYWNNKRPKSSTLYPARPPIGSVSNVLVDPRLYFNPFSGVFPQITGKNNDEIAAKAHKWVVANVTYTSDTSQFKDDEVWLFPFETLKLKKGDCEDGAILLANILLANGIPYWRVRLNAGDVKGGGHAWVTYLRELDDQWVILDWCYWADKSYDLKELYQTAEDYYTIWFSFNTKYLYLDEGFTRITSTKLGGKKKNGKHKSRTKSSK
jgi:predicted transglutaminase-like cysteine proteinase